MTFPPSRVAELLEILSLAPDPLTLSVAIAEREDDASARLAIVAAATSAITGSPSVRALQALERFARHVSRTPDAVPTAERLRSVPTRAAQWTAAMLFEALDCHGDAAQLLAGGDAYASTDEHALWLTALARNLVRDGRVAECWRPLRLAVRAATGFQTLAKTARALAEAARLEPPPSRVDRRIAIVGTGTLGFWADALKPMLFAYGVNADILPGEYGQYQQEVRDPTSTLATFRPDTIIIAVDHRGLGIPDFTEDADRTVETTVQQFVDLWTICRERFPATVIQCNVEIPVIDPLGRLSAAVGGGRARVLHRINLRLAEAAETERVVLFDMNEAAATHGKGRWSVEAMWFAAKQYPAAEAMPALSRQLAHVIRAAAGLTSKCIVLDLDNTLWGGVIGEDGLAGIRLGGDAEGEAYVTFHRYLRGLRERGIALAVCSKNNEADARSVFREHPESVLKESDFAAFLANWEPKPENLRNIAATLNIGLDSLVFVDDNAAERHFIRQELPEVEVPELPDDPSRFAEALHHSGLFEAVSLTAEDRLRAESYRANAQRNALATGTATDVEKYLADLDMHVELRPFDPINLPRIVQLINKTNQFNLTTRRTTEAEVERWIHDPACYTQFMRMRDRFGDNGLTGVLIAAREGSRLTIHTWLMSCRVLGRRIENAMLAAVIAHARRAGVVTLIGQYRPTPKNDQVRDLYERFGFVRVADADGTAVYELDVAAATPPRTDCLRIEDATMMNFAV